MRILVKWDPEIIEAYTTMCAVGEKGQPRFAVLAEGKKTGVVRMYCYGRRIGLLPSVYIINVPKEAIEIMKKSRNDAEVLLTMYSDKPEEFMKTLKTLKPDKEVVEDIKPDIQKLIEAAPPSEKIAVELVAKATLGEQSPQSSSPEKPQGG